ncbi:hypothetical protein AB0H43_13025 [Hamadaea sp. NPDC050747]|uniref:hypothetical protein n=1 Tax=Hamadaea sp. NPDC050747 TaxID=3155789 RepID=UPI0033ED43A6
MLAAWQATYTIANQPPFGADDVDVNVTFSLTQTNGLSQDCAEIGLNCGSCSKLGTAGQAILATVTLNLPASAHQHPGHFYLVLVDADTQQLATGMLGPGGEGLSLRLTPAPEQWLAPLETTDASEQAALQIQPDSRVLSFASAIMSRAGAVTYRLALGLIYKGENGRHIGRNEAMAL